MVPARRVRPAISPAAPAGSRSARRHRRHPARRAAGRDAGHTRSPSPAGPFGPGHRAGHRHGL